MSNKELYIDNLKKKLSANPSSPKADAWRKIIANTDIKQVRNFTDKQINQMKPEPRRNRELRNRRRQPLQISKRESPIIESNCVRGTKVFKGLDNKINPQVYGEQQLAVDMGRTMAGMLNPRSGPFRLNDNVQTETAVMYVTQTIPVYANPAAYNGEFRCIIQPRLGNPSQPVNYRIAMFDPNGNGNFSDQGAFMQTVDGNDLTVIPNLEYLITGARSQNTMSLTSLMQPG